MSSNPQRLGPWLRQHQSEPKKTWRDVAAPILIGLGAAVVFLVVLFFVLKSLFRYPGITIGVVAAIWLVGFLISLQLRRRDRSRGGGGL